MQRGDTEKVDPRVADQIHRYFVAMYGTDYIYRAPETHGNLVEQWMRSVAVGDLAYADKVMTRIEEKVKEVREGEAV
jgi:hypothetical protein